MSRKKLRKQKQRVTQQLTKQLPFVIKTVTPKTPGQEKIFESFDSEQNLMIHGYAGTGKTFISLYLALDEILQENSNYDKVIIIRSAVPTRKIGFVPGKLSEKLMDYELPYKEICSKLTGKDNSYNQLKQQGKIEFISTSFIRGTTFDKCIILVDETQNLSWHESSSVITRMGVDCKIIFCGDYRQSDLTDSSKRDIVKMNSVCSAMNCFDFIELNESDIVRSSIVKQFIITAKEKGYEI